MHDEPKPLQQVLEQEYSLIATRPGHALTGTEITLEKALAVARGLALGGWNVRVSASDPDCDDFGLVHEVWCEQQ